MCGVAEPITDFQGMPLSPLAEGWCLLAMADVECDLDARIERRLPDAVHDQIEPRSEVRLRLARMSRAIRRSDVDAYVEALGPWIDAHTWIGRQASAVCDEAAGRTPLSRVRTEEWPHGGPRNALLASLTAFVLVAATSDETGRLDELGAKLSPLLDDDALGREVASMVAVAAAVEGVPRTLAETAALMRPGRPRNPVDSMRVSIRLLQAAAQVVEHGLGKAVGRPLADWVGAEWSRSATRQAFALVAPSRNAPAILEAVASSTGDVRSAARIVEAALPAVGAIASGGIRSFVSAMAGRRGAPSA